MQSVSDKESWGDIDITWKSGVIMNTIVLIDLAGVHTLVVYNLPPMVVGLRTRQGSGLQRLVVRGRHRGRNFSFYIRIISITSNFINIH